MPPRPGDLVFRVRGEDRELALHFDRMEQKLAAGFSRDGLGVSLSRKMRVYVLMFNLNRWFGSRRTDPNGHVQE
jgi:hypothetical protein